MPINRQLQRSIKIDKSHTIKSRLYHYFYIYFETCSIPTTETLVLLLLSILTLESADSIRFLYRHFLSKLTDKSLNAFYYACSYAIVAISYLNSQSSTFICLMPLWETTGVKSIVSRNFGLWSWIASNGASSLSRTVFPPPYSLPITVSATW